MKNESMVDVGTYHIDDDGAGRIYVPKKIAEAIGFDSKTKVTVRYEDGKLVVEKLV
jgi:bifunctional DNA-binding transcriptional regulator/antitoxin component of YhaV-PrlF toxin-antitoxin module